METLYKHLLIINLLLWHTLVYFGVRYTCTHGLDLRLRGGPDNLSGRLEVKKKNDRIWGTVCDDHFDDKAASVACKQMGHRTGKLLCNAGYSSCPALPGKGLIWLDDVRCKGNETSLELCMSREWGHHACIHYEDVVLSCYPHIRIDKMVEEHVGYLEIQYNGVWGGICAHSFHRYAAFVACTEMGYQTGIITKLLYTKTRNHNDILLDYLTCKGNELSVAECGRSRWGESNCTRSERVVLECIKGTGDLEDIRLYGGRLSGVLEVKYMGIWGTVCHNQFDDNAANVVCRELGYDFGQYQRNMGNTTNYYSLQHHTIWLDNVQCTGDEVRLNDCSKSPLGAHDCEHWEDVVMRCFVGSHSTLRYQLQLFHGKNDVSGRLKMIYGGVPYLFCHSSFTVNEVNVACKEMGMVSGDVLPLQYPISNESKWLLPYTLSSDHQLWRTEVHCHGYESRLADCFSVEWAEPNCMLPGDELTIYCTRNSRLEFHDYDSQKGTITNTSITVNGNVLQNVCIHLFSTTHSLKVFCSEIFNDSDIGNFLDYDILHNSKYRFNCAGYEQRLSECLVEPTPHHYRMFCKSAKIKCMKYTFKISGGSTSSSGQLTMQYLYAPDEHHASLTKIVVYHPLTYYICNDGSPFNYIPVVCREMGYKQGRLIGSEKYKHTYMYDSIRVMGLPIGSVFQCTGNENHIRQCSGGIESNKLECPYVGGPYILNDVQIKCYYDSDYDFRLGSDSYVDSGPLEVFYNGSWGAVCFAQNTSDISAELACNHMGYSFGTHLSSTEMDKTCGRLNKDSTIWLDGISCLGNEKNLVDCKRGEWGKHFCDDCKRLILKCSNKLRLHNSNTGLAHLYSGFLEINYQGRWGTVCKSMFDNKAAYVICQEMGYNNGRQVENITSYNNGIPIWLHNIHCTGNETSLGQCQKGNWGENNCTHADDVFLQCWNDDRDGFKIRLVDGQDTTSGRLEVLYIDQWGTVCYNNKDKQINYVAEVACKQLGFKSGSYFNVQEPLSSFGPIWLENIVCNGGETSLLDCDRNGWGYHDCDHTMDVHVKCWNDNFQLRITNNGSIGTLAGRLEIQYNGIWGTMCRQCDGTAYPNSEMDYVLFDNNIICNLEAVAQVACRQMGYVSGKLISREVTNLNNNTPVWITSADCSGDEISLEDCNLEINSDGDFYSDSYYYTHITKRKHTHGFATAIQLVDHTIIYFRHYIVNTKLYGSVEYYNCDHDSDVHIECWNLELRLTGGSEHHMGKLEIKYNSMWGRVCDDLFNHDNNAATVACKEMGYVYGLVIENVGFLDVDPQINPIWLDDVVCDGTEAGIAQCKHAGWGQHNCDHTEDVVIQCFNDQRTTVSDDHPSSQTETWYATTNVQNTSNDIKLNNSSLQFVTAPDHVSAPELEDEKSLNCMSSINFKTNIFIFACLVHGYV